MKKFLLYLLMVIFCYGCAEETKPPQKEKYRPQIHFTPEAHWMNDPNGLVYYNGVYHLFYQYYPDSTVWGPMHWGHATSTDLVHWTHRAIALYPDSLGYIFSGSAVADINNTSGFGKDGKIPLVAIFTHHDPDGEKVGKNTYQNQSIAYSVDNGNTWTKYDSNPVLKNPGIKDFRDPKVRWYEPGRKWIMTLATLDRITFYSSPDLKKWKKESEFGKDEGAHGGVWECPDLFPLKYNGQEIWVLLVSINPGGPNGGSATQYFTGKFDGHTFTPSDTDLKWLDNGPDDYAGVTWSNTGERKIFLGWMSNWQYATRVPTEKWRSAMTMPRDLSVEKIDEKFYVRSVPSAEINALEVESKSPGDINGKIDVTEKSGLPASPSMLHFKMDTLQSFAVTLSNDSSQKTIVGYDKNANEFYIDRKASGETDFEKGFASRSTAKRVAITDSCDVTLIVDDASVELFADGGLSVMTAIFFPGAVYNHITIEGQDIKQIKFSRLKH